MLLMRAIAEVPGSTFELYSVRKLTKRYRQQQKEKKANTKQVNSSAANWGILSMEGERLNVDKDERVLYRTAPEFIRLISKVSVAAICPGYSQVGDTDKAKLVVRCGARSH